MLNTSKIKAVTYFSNCYKISYNLQLNLFLCFRFALILCQDFILIQAQTLYYFATNRFTDLLFMNYGDW